ncbi:glutathione S-transferase N-terminal domain-containing protein, partial [SAR116 cluster bacterium]|nr:glutathione S-transferase N-terminal domain-containing protein [SAR116 cluster bacterium]
MIELHIAPTPNAHKVSIALEEMGLKYEIHRVNINEGDQFKPEFLAFSPNNRIPA